MNLNLFCFIKISKSLKQIKYILMDSAVFFIECEQKTSLEVKTHIYFDYF